MEGLMRRLNIVLLPSVLIITVAILLFRTGAASTASPTPSHKNCGVWSSIASPNVAALGNGLTAVSAVSATDIWAVGNLSGPNGYQTLVEHWNGTQWSIASSSSVGSLNGVAAIATNNVWAVGSRASTNNIQTLI